MANCNECKRQDDCPGLNHCVHGHDTQGESGLVERLRTAAQGDELFGFDGLREEPDQLLTEAANEIERNAKDAERYRWLKHNPQWLGWDHDFSPDEVEREIDAAMAPPQEQK